MQVLAQLLWNARRLGHTIDAAACARPKTVEEAYAIQDEVVALSELAPVGYKVGSTSKEAQQLLGTDEPGAGILLRPYVFDSPAEVGIVPAHMPAVEGEFAFRMACDIPPRTSAYTISEVSDAIGYVAGAIEIVGTRFAGGLAGKGRLLTTADCGVNIALVTGAWVEWRAQNLRSYDVTMSINGAKRGAGSGARALGDPVNVLHWLANHLSGRGRGLRANDIVSTGTCTGLDAVNPNDGARAEFGDLGAVEISFGQMA